MFAELLSKRDGYFRGKGRPMNIADGETCHLGAKATIAGGTAIATGAALSAKVRGADQLSVCFIGAGALNEELFFCDPDGNLLEFNEIGTGQQDLHSYDWDTRG